MPRNRDTEFMPAEESEHVELNCVLSTGTAKGGEACGSEHRHRCSCVGRAEVGETDID